jgi:1,4-dihydroxy-2-naphthoate octaprenyltransferase
MADEENLRVWRVSLALLLGFVSLVLALFAEEGSLVYMLGLLVLAAAFLVYAIGSWRRWFG